MNVLTTRVVLRERTLAEVFDLAFRFVAVRGGRKYLRLWLGACAPPLALCVVLRYLQVEWGWVWLVACAGFVSAQIPFTLAASRLLLGDDLTLSSLTRAWLPRIPGQLVMHALAGTLIGATGFVVVPIPFLAARFLYLPEITLLEGSGLIRAFERGTRLCQNRMAHALTTCVLLLTVWAAFILGAEVLGRAVQDDLLSLPAPADALVNGGSWFALCGFFAAVPFLATARFLAYIDGRTRREAWDVQLRFTELAKSPRGASVNEVDQTQLDKSLEHAFSEGELPYCHDKTYRLKYSEHWLCSLSKADQQRCPAFKEQCGVSVKPEVTHESDSGSGMHVAPWIGAVAEVLFWGLVATLVVALVVSLIRLRKAQKDVKDEAEERNSLEPDVPQTPAATLAGDKDVQRLLERARRAAERGDLAAAIDAAHAAAVQGLSAAGHVELDRDRTNGDYLRDLRKAPPLQQEFKVIVGQVEVAQFGGAVPSRSAFDRLLDQVLALLRRLAVLSLLLLPLSLLGCGAQHGGGDQDRGPAGLYVFKHLLADQGAKVHMRLLPLSKPDAGVGVIVAYDAELEEPEQKRVLDWVRRGGKLVVVGNSEFSAAGEVERSMQGCGAVAERGPNQELLPLKLAVIGEDSLRLAPKSESVVPQRVDVTCGGHPYIVTSFLEEGSITFMPERELLTNASLSVADNARLVAELVPADEGMIELVGPWTGDGSQSPMQSLKSAGLMPVMLQLFGLALLLALRQGTSFGARRDVQTRSRRAFADHVRAVASTYARANAGRLASGHYGLLLIDQLRERTCPGQRPTLLQLAAAIARRVRRPENQIVQLLVEAKTAFEEQGDGQGVNHKLVRELEQLSSQAGGIS